MKHIESNKIGAVQFVQLKDHNSVDFRFTLNKVTHQLVHDVWFTGTSSELCRKLGVASFYTVLDGLTIVFLWLLHNWRRCDYCDNHLAKPKCFLHCLGQSIWLRRRSRIGQGRHYEIGPGRHLKFVEVRRWYDKNYQCLRCKELHFYQLFL